ncbi:DUF4202 domain-containing protein [Salipiger marinus]|uniref:DUF4202 domain-containing protein n=1 Tax=Salipiger marinus TaxID=555512 RepID=UPI001E5BAF09|nr:DUF4202 domain-containing protein [Salipiger manganoxidans]MCD1619745.1 DUF4202 domain-containing protein [Salipiger manganoxidans]MEB3420601.1 DUF4202 domain-containing protein [Salipiger manganoxidans]
MTDHPPRLAATLTAIDAANAADPDTGEGTAAALLYGQRMTAELDRIFPDASEVLRIAARGQHVERWLLPRDSYPEGRAGYLEWRREQGRRHAARLQGFMAKAGYDAAAQEQVGRMLRKEGLKRDRQVQALEDVICITFLKWYFLPFAEGRDAEELDRIVTRTALKMSPEGRARVLREFDLPEPFVAAFRA